MTTTKKKINDEFMNIKKIHNKSAFGRTICCPDLQYS